MWSNSSATVTEMFNQPITAGKEENKPNGKNNWKSETKDLLPESFVASSNHHCYGWEELK